MGNIKFEADARGYAMLNNNQEMQWVSKVKSKKTARSINNLSPFMQLTDDTVKKFDATWFGFLFWLQLLGIPNQVLQQGLTHRKIEAKSEEVAYTLTYKIILTCLKC